MVPTVGPEVVTRRLRNRSPEASTTALNVSNSASIWSPVRDFFVQKQATRWVRSASKFLRSWGQLLPFHALAKTSALGRSEVAAAL
eukprot:2770523-Pyramimonas_sp.AAC.1